MDKLPSRHAITEVMTWISLMENVIKEDEQNIRNVVGCEAIQEYLLKYKVMLKHRGGIKTLFHWTVLLIVILSGIIYSH